MEYGHISHWDTSSVNNMSGLFQDLTEFNLPLSGWDTSNVTNMEGMFNGAETFNHPLNHWNVGNVTNMKAMFQNCSAFNQSLHNLNTSNVRTMIRMFYRAANFNGRIRDWDVTNVREMIGMFYLAQSCLDVLVIPWYWKIDEDCNTAFMFQYTLRTRLSNIWKWNTRNVHKLWRNVQTLLHSIHRLFPRIYLRPWRKFRRDAMGKLINFIRLYM